MSKRPRTPTLPGVPTDGLSSGLRSFLQGVKSVLDTMQGQRGDRDRAVTFRDLEAGGLAVARTSGYVVVPGSGGGDGGEWNGEIPDIEDIVPQPGPDETPPALQNFQVSAAYKSVILSWDDPDWPPGAGTFNIQAFQIFRSTTQYPDPAPPDLSLLAGSTNALVFTDNTGTDKSYWYWVRAVGKNGKEGPLAGPLQATTAPDVPLLLEKLTNQLTESQLTSLLRSRIALIDTPTTGLFDRTGALEGQIASINSQLSDISATPDYDGETTYNEGDLVKYDGALYRAKATTTGNLPTNTTYWDKVGDYASLGEAVAAFAGILDGHESRIDTAEGNITAVTSAHNDLAAQLTGGYTGTDVTALTSGLIHSEREARVSALEAEATAREQLESKVDDNDTTVRGLITTEATTRSTQDSVLAQTISNVNTRLNSGGDTYIAINNAMNTASVKNATFVQSATPTATKVNDLWIKTNENNRIYRWNGSAWEPADDTRIGATATSLTNLATQLRGSYTGSDLNAVTTGLIASERQARSTTDEALADEIERVEARMDVGGDTYSAISQAQTTASAKNATFVQSGTPTATKPNDLWVHTGEGNRLYRWNGSAWAPADDVRIGASVTSIQTLQARQTTTTTTFNETWEGDTAQWTNYSGAGELSIISSAESAAGGKVLKIGNRSGNDMWWGAHKDNIALSPGIVYKITARLRRRFGVGAVYLGFLGVGSDGTTLVNTTGGASSSSQHYTNNVSSFTTDEWVEIVGYGKAGGAGAQNSTSLTNPRGFHANVKYIRPLLLVGYNSEPGEFEVDYVRVDQIADNVAAVQMLADASASDVTGLKAQWAVRVNAGDYVVGIGLASGEGGTSEFSVVADAFSIAPVSTDHTADDGSPFFYRTVATTINGVSVAPGAYMKSAFIHDAAITTAKIMDLAVDTAKIANLAVTGAKIADATIQNAKIADATIQHAKIASVDAATISVGYLSGDRIAANTIKANHIDAGAVTADKVSSTSLAAINAVLGDVYAGSLRGGAYTGWGWPSAGAGGGFYLGPNGMLLGNYNQWAANPSGSSTGYIQLNQNGTFSSPYFNISTNGVTISGNAVVRGDVQATSLNANAANIVNTLHVAGNAITVPNGAKLTTSIGDGWGAYITLPDLVADKPVLVWCSCGTTDFGVNGRPANATLRFYYYNGGYILQDSVSRPVAIGMTGDNINTSDTGLPTSLFTVFWPPYAGSWLLRVAVDASNFGGTVTTISAIQGKR